MENAALTRKKEVGGLYFDTKFQVAGTGESQIHLDHQEGKVARDAYQKALETCKAALSRSNTLKMFYQPS